MSGLRGTAVAGLTLVALLLLGSTLSLAHSPPETLIEPIPHLHPRDDGSLATEPGESPAACVGLGNGSSAPSSATFNRSLVDGTYHPATHDYSLLIDLQASDGGDQAASGTGFTVDAELSFGDGTSASASRSYGSNTQVDATHLSFSLEEDEIEAGSGDLELPVSLSSSGTAPIAGGQDVEVVCNAVETRLDRFDVALGPPGADDADCDGVPDTEDPEIGTCEGAGTEGGGPQVAAVSPVLVGGLGFLAAATAFGAGMLPLAGKGVSERRLHLLLGLSAGVLLTVAFAKMIPRAFELAPSGGWIVVATFGALLAVEWGLGGHGHDHSHGREGEDHEHDDDHDDPGVGTGTSVALIALIALSVHRFVGGLSMPAAFGLGETTGATVVGAIMLHQIPDGLAAASLFLAGGWSRRKVIGSVAGVALWVPVGAIVGLAFISFADLLPQLLALSAGTFLYIATVEVIPEILDSDHRFAVAGGFVVGIVLAWALVVQLTGMFG